MFLRLDNAVVIQNGNFAWSSDALNLKNINLRIKEGSIVAVVGTVGNYVIIWEVLT